MGEARLRVVEYRGVDMLPRKSWWIRWRLISDPPIADFFFTVRAGVLAFFAWCLLGGWVVSYSFGSLWYAESGWGHGIIVMSLDSRYANRIGIDDWRISSSGFQDAPPQVISSILASAPAGHWPYAHWVRVPAWLVTGLLGAILVMVWRWTRLRGARHKGLGELSVDAIMWFLLIVLVFVVEMLLLSALL